MIPMLSPWTPRPEERDPDAPPGHPSSGRPDTSSDTDPAADTADTATSEASTLPVADLSGLPWLFNPPVHPSLLHAVPEWTDSVYNLRNTYGTETSHSYSADTDFTKLRLGRMVMGKQAWTYAAQEMGTRFGFRFLYNPGSIKGGTYINGDFVVNPAVTMAAILQDGLESISFELLLNRMPELQGGATPDSFRPAITEDDLAKIRKYGTHWDLEFIYRICNGLHETRSSSEKTGDIGVLLPNPTVLYLGPFKSTGNVEMISAEDTMFTLDMVPMVTKVSIVFRRILMMKGASINEVKNGSTSTTTDTGGTTAPPVNTPAPTVFSGDTLPGADVYKLMKWQNFSDDDATLMTKIAWAESSWRRKVRNALPCIGLWQINMSPGLAPGRMQDLNLSSLEDLEIPEVNARAARKIWDQQGWEAWTTYHDAKNSTKTW